MKHNFLIRLRSSVILTALAALGFWAGGLCLFLLVAAASLIGLFELYQVLGLKGSAPAAAGFMGALLYLEGVWLGWHSGLLLCLFLAFMLLAGTLVFTYPRYTPEQLALAFLGVLYVPGLLSFLFMTHREAGVWTAILILLSSWGSDVFAYCSGMLFGKHKLCPALSPKKTVEGACGAVILSAGLGALYGLLFRDKLTLFGSPAAACALITGLGSLLSQLGDLTASAVKRCRGIKDYGTLIPGHGGVMDRFDSVIVTAPAIYFLTMILSR